MLLTFLLMLVVIAVSIGWGVFMNVSMYKHGAIKTRRFAHPQIVGRTPSVAPDDLYSAQVDQVYDNSRRYLWRAMTFVFFTVVFLFFFIALLLNAFVHWPQM